MYRPCCSSAGCRQCPGASLTRRVFISHATKDIKFVGKLKRSLVRRGIFCWLSENEIIGGTNWIDEIGRALQSCDAFLIVLSPESVKSMWVKREVEFVLRKPNYAERIIPVLLKKCEIGMLSWPLPGYQYIDF